MLGVVFLSLVAVVAVVDTASCWGMKLLPHDLSPVQCNGLVASYCLCPLPTALSRRQHLRRARRGCAEGRRPVMGAQSRGAGRDALSEAGAGPGLHTESRQGAVVAGAVRAELLVPTTSVVSSISPSSDKFNSSKEIS